MTPARGHGRRAWAMLAAAPLALVASVTALTGPGGAPAAQAAATYHVTKQGVPYAQDDPAKQNVTLYTPDGAPGRRPVAYFVHGGGWTGGGRAAWDDVAHDWATHGWVAVNLDYRVPVASNDGALLLDDVKTVVETYEAKAYTDRTRQVIVGDSAGGHLATTTGAKMRGHFVGVIAWSPVASPENAAADGRLPGATPQQQVLGEKAQRFFGYSFRTTSAERYVEAYGGPPMWIAGSTDEWVTWNRQGGQLCKALLKFAGPSGCESHVVPGVLHGNDIRDRYPALADSAYSFAMHRIGAWT